MRAELFSNPDSYYSNYSFNNSLYKKTYIGGNSLPLLCLVYIVKLRKRGYIWVVAKVMEVRKPFAELDKITQ